MNTFDKLRDAALKIFKLEARKKVSKKEMQEASAIFEAVFREWLDEIVKETVERRQLAEIGTMLRRKKYP